MAAGDATTLIVSVYHGTVDLGVPVSVSYEEVMEDIVIQGPGEVGPSLRGIVRRDLACAIGFIDPPQVSPNTGPADLVITYTSCGGDTVTDTLLDMISRGFSSSFDRGSPPGNYIIRFVHQGAMVDSPVEWA